MKFTLALTLLLSLFLAQQGGDLDNYIQEDGRSCPMEGTAKSAKGKDLDRHKNRYIAPGTADIDKEVTLMAMVAPGDDAERFDTEKAATLIGFVRDAKPGGRGETCNCNSKNDVDMDTHVEIALTEDAPPNQRVIVEVTPRLRMLMKQKKVDWSTQALARSGSGIKGKWVEFTGWLMFDFIHADGAENTNPGNPTNWRATCWEIHPITSMKVLDGPPPNLTRPQTEVLAAFHKANANAALRSPKKQDEIKKRLASYLEGLDPEELKEKEEEGKQFRP